MSKKNTATDLRSFKNADKHAAKRIEKAEETLNTGLAKKWGFEATKTKGAGIAAALKDMNVSATVMESLAIYAMQKVRKMGAFMAGERSSIDGYSLAILKAAAKLSKAGVTFTPNLQQAALSSAIEVKDSSHVTKLGTRLSHSIGTARSQTNTTRQALEACGAVSADTIDGTRNCLVVNESHPLVMKALG